MNETERPLKVPSGDPPARGLRAGARDRSRSAAALAGRAAPRVADRVRRFVDRLVRLRTGCGRPRPMRHSRMPHARARARFCPSSKTAARRRRARLRSRSVKRPSAGSTDCARCSSKRAARRPRCAIHWRSAPSTRPRSKTRWCRTRRASSRPIWAHALGSSRASRRIWRTLRPARHWPAFFPDRTPRVGPRVALAAAVRAYVPAIDPHGEWAPLDEEWRCSRAIRSTVRSPVCGRTWCARRSVCASSIMREVRSRSMIWLLSVDGTLTAGLSVEQVEQLARVEPPQGQSVRSVRVLRGTGSNPSPLELSIAFPQDGARRANAPRVARALRRGLGTSDHDQRSRRSLWVTIWRTRSRSRARTMILRSAWCSTCAVTAAARPTARPPRLVCSCPARRASR